MDAKQFIAKRTAKFFKDGDLVNLGIGMPTMCMAYIDPSIDVWFQSENGIIGMTGTPKEGEPIDLDVVDAGGSPSGFFVVLGYILSVVLIVIGVISTYKLAKAFGKGFGFFIGLLLLNPIFKMILGFGSAQYQGRQGN